MSDNKLSPTEQKNSFQYQIIQHLLKNGEANRFLFINIHQGHNDSLIQKKVIANFSQQLKQSLDKSSLFSSIENGQKTNSLIIDKIMYKYRYLINADIDDKYYSTKKLKEKFSHLEAKLEMLASPQEQQLIAQDPLNTWFDYLSNLKHSQLKTIHGVWFNQQMEAIILLKTKAAGFNLKQQQINISLLQEKINQLKLQEAYKNMITDISGTSTIALSSKEKISFQIKVLSTTASLVLLFFLYYFFRSFRLLFIITLPLILAILVGMSTVNYIYGYVHGIALAFGITIIGVVVDYPLHYFVHLKKSQNKQLKDDNRQKIIKQIWPKIRLGLMTTTVGFMAIAFSAFSGLNQLALFAISGLLSAALLTRYILPLFIYKHNKSPILAFNSFFSMLYFLNKTVKVQYTVYAFLLLAIIYIYTVDNLWEDDLASLSTVSLQKKNKDFNLRRSLNLPEINFLFVINASSQQKVLERSEQFNEFLNSLKNKNIISYYDSVTRYLPSIKKQIERQQLIPAEAELNLSLQQAFKSLPFSYKAFSPFISAVVASKNYEPLQIQDLNDSLLAGKINSLFYQEAEAEAEAGTNELRPEENDLTIKKQWHSLILLSGVDGKRLLPLFKQHKEKFDGIDLIDVKAQSQLLLKTYRIEALQWFALGFTLMIILLYAYTKNFASLLALIIPFSGAVIFTIASLLMMGYSLSIFHLVTLLLILGLGIDYSIFMNDKLNTHTTLTNNLDINQLSVLMCALSSFIMFFALSLSTIPVLKAIGLTAVLGITYAFILTLIIHRPMSCKK